MKIKRLLAPLLLAAALAVSAVAKPATVAVTGKVRQPLEFTLKSVQQRWPDQVKLSSFKIKDREEKGYAIDLLHCLQASQVDYDLQERNGEIRFVLQAQGKDEYVAAMSLAEISPELGNRKAVLLWSEDGEKVRLVMPEDGKPSRSVYALQTIRVIELQPEIR